MLRFFRGESMMLKSQMMINRSEFKKFQNAKKKKLRKNMFEEPSILSIERCKRSGLEAYKYVYIYEHYDELKKMFE